MHTAEKDPAPAYESILGTFPSAIPHMNLYETTALQNGIPPPPAYSFSPEIKSWNVPAAAPPPWNFASILQQNVDSSSPFFKTFLQAKPKALGVVLILVAILQIALGIGLFFTLFSITVASGNTFWGSVFYIIAGALTIAAQTKPNVCLVKGSLALNIISAVVSIIAIILHGVDLANNQCPSYTSNYNYYNDDHDGHHENSYNNNYYIINNTCQQLMISRILHSLLLVISVFVFCVSLSVSIFGCRSLSHVPTNVSQVIVIQNDVLVSTKPSTVPGMFPAFPQPPPPLYTGQQVTEIPKITIP